MEVLSAKPYTEGHTFDDATLVCSKCGVTLELLEWARGEVKCSLAEVALAKRDRYFYDLGRSSRADEIADLKLALECHTALLKEACLSVEGK